MSNQVTNDPDVPLSSKFLQLKVYAWLSIALVTLAPIIKDSPNVYHRGIRGLLTTTADKSLSSSAQLHNALIVLILLILFLFLWIRANVILLITDNKDRAKNILNWLIFLSLAELVGGLLPRPNWQAVTISFILVMATAATRYKLSSSTDIKLYHLSIPELRQRIFTSTPFYFIVYAVPFGVFEGFSNHQSHGGFSLSGAIVSGAIFGTGMSFATKRRLKKSAQAAGLSDPKKQHMLYTAIRTAELPNDTEVRQALPAYIDKRIELNRKSKKSSLGIMVILGLGSLGFAVFGHSILFAILSAWLLLLVPLLYRAINKAARNMDSLQTQLEALKNERAK
jgi:uncharacterized membrane protein